MGSGGACLNPSTQDGRGKLSLRPAWFTRASSKATEKLCLKKKEKKKKICISRLPKLEWTRKCY